MRTPLWQLLRRLRKGTHLLQEVCALSWEHHWQSLQPLGRLASDTHRVLKLHLTGQSWLHSDNVAHEVSHP